MTRDNDFQLDFGRAFNSWADCELMMRAPELFDSFVPAVNKLEAVARISSLTLSGEEYLGPGSKERKSVLINLARGLGLEIPNSYSKHQFARSLASAMGVAWGHECESAGQTITLLGLNRLLEGATSILWSNDRQLEFDWAASNECMEIGRVAIQVVPRSLDGRKSVLRLQSIDHKDWRQTEWQGFYLESIVQSALIGNLGGRPVRIGNTNFDYSKRHVWDLKVHSSVGQNGRPNSSCQLNDREAMKEASLVSGIGFLVISGVPTYSMAFTKWHKNLRGGGDSEPRRLLKENFEVERIDAFLFENHDEFEHSIASGILRDFRQGRQQSGAPRRPKLMLDLRNALGSTFHRFEHVL